MYMIRFDETSNAADWVDSWQVLGPDGVPANIYADGWVVTINIAALPPNIGHANYGSWFSGSVILTASTASGTIVVTADDALEWTFTAAQMATLCPGAYAVGCLATKAGQTVQLFLGTLPVVQGI